MINPTFNPLAASLVAANSPQVVVAAPPAQNVTPRPALPSHKNEGARARDRRDAEAENQGKSKAKGERGASTDLTV
jgi:hypothetical protein